jgi:hypothetical protein
MTNRSMRSDAGDQYWISDLRIPNSFPATTGRAAQPNTDLRTRLDPQYDHFVISNAHI